MAVFMRKLVYRRRTVGPVRCAVKERGPACQRAYAGSRTSTPDTGVLALMFSHRRRTGGFALRRPRTPLSFGVSNFDVARAGRPRNLRFVFLRSDARGRELSRQSE